MLHKSTFFKLLFLANVSLQANMGPDGFSQFSNKYFIETGTNSGSSVCKALDLGFLEIRSIEFRLDCFKHCKRKFADFDNVKLYHGDSSKDLWMVIKDIDAPATFWLDAHVFPPRTDGVKNCPLIGELEQIKNHPIKTHTILIDDMHCCGTEAFDLLTKKDIIRKILEINPAYQITYIAGGDEGEVLNNVMVATIPK